MFYDRKNANQMLRYDKLGAFVEFMTDSFNINRIKINFINYDRNTKKAKDRSSYYMKTSDFFYLSKMIASGMFFQQVQMIDSTSQGQRNIDYFEFKSGITESNGNSVSKLFKIQKGKSSRDNKGKEIRMWNLFLAEFSQPKAEAEKRSNVGKTSKFFNVPITTQELFEIVGTIEMHLQAYVNMVYRDYGHRIFPTLNNDGGYTTFFYENVYDKDYGSQGSGRQGYKQPARENSYNNNNKSFQQNANYQQGNNQQGYQNYQQNQNPSSYNKPPVSTQNPNKPIYNQQAAPQQNFNQQPAQQGYGQQAPQPQQGYGQQQGYNPQGQNNNWRY